MAIKYISLFLVREKSKGFIEHRFGGKLYKYRVQGGEANKIIISGWYVLSAIELNALLGCINSGLVSR